MYLIRVNVPVPNMATLTVERYELNKYLYRMRVPWLICAGFEDIVKTRVKDRVASVLEEDQDSIIYHVQPVTGDHSLVVQVIDLDDNKGHFLATRAADQLLQVAYEEARSQFREFYSNE